MPAEGGGEEEKGRKGIPGIPDIDENPARPEVQTSHLTLYTAVTGPEKTRSHRKSGFFVGRGRFAGAGVRRRYRRADRSC